MEKQKRQKNRKDIINYIKFKFKNENEINIFNNYFSLVDYLNNIKDFFKIQTLKNVNPFGEDVINIVPQRILLETDELKNEYEYYKLNCEEHLICCGSIYYGSNSKFEIFRIGTQNKIRYEIDENGVTYKILYKKEKSGRHNYKYDEEAFNLKKKRERYKKLNDGYYVLKIGYAQYQLPNYISKKIYELNKYKNVDFDSFLIGITSTDGENKQQYTLNYNECYNVKEEDLRIIIETKLKENIESVNVMKCNDNIIKINNGANSPTNKPYSYFVSGERNVDPIHYELQKRFVEWLYKQNKENIIKDDKYIDVQYTENGKLYYCEVKKTENNKDYFRNAIGQLLIYRARNNRNAYLVIVIDYKPSEEDMFDMDVWNNDNNMKLKIIYESSNGFISIDSTKKITEYNECIKSI